MKVKIYNQEGKEIGNQELNPEIFGLEIKKEVIHQVVNAQLANLRQPFAHTKTKGEIRGGGKKPWQQKGTGRARSGSIRSPLWRGGGTTFGPLKERNYKQKVNKKVRRKVLLMCLSDKVKNDNLILLDKLELPEIKTKKMIEILKNFPTKGKKTLIVLNEKDKNVVRSVKNIQVVKAVSSNNLNVLDLLKYKFLLLTLDSLKIIENNYKKVL